MSERRYLELNGRLAEPPEFDVFNSEQLGLFVVGQLAKRHGIRVSLRPSPYGGTTAIALIPTTLVGVEEGFVEGLPTGMTAISSAWAATPHEMPAGDTTVQPSSSRTELTGHSWSALPHGNGSSGPANRDAPAAGGAGLVGSFAAGPSLGADPYADQPSPGLSNGGPANGGSSGAPSNGPGMPYGEQPYGTDPYTGQAYGWTSPPSGSSFGPPADTGPAPTETGLPWPYDRPRQPAATAWASRARPVPGERPGRSARGRLPALHTGRNGLPAAGESLPGLAGAAARRAAVPAGAAFLFRGRARHAAGPRLPPQRRDGPAARRFVPQRERGPGAAGQGTRGCRSGSARPAWRRSSATAPHRAARRRRRPGTTSSTARPTTSATRCRRCSMAGSRDAPRTRAARPNRNAEHLAALAARFPEHGPRSRAALRRRTGPPDHH